MTLRDGELYAQVAFSAASDQGFEAGGHGVLKSGSAGCRTTRSTVSILCCRSASARALVTGHARPGHVAHWRSGKPVTARNITADLQGITPTEDNPLLLTNVKVETLGGKITMQQLRMPQHDPALLRVDNISSSELISAVNPKQFTLSGPVSGRCRSGWTMKNGSLKMAG